MIVLLTDAIQTGIAVCMHGDIYFSCIFSHILLFTVLSNCADGDVRLVDGKNEQEGRVEVCQNRVWGAIANRWTFQEAKVVCIQLGYASACKFTRRISLIYHI